MIAEIEDAALTRACSYCTAPAGVWCQRHAWTDRAHRGDWTGPASYLHGARTADLWAIWRAARVEGIADGAQLLAWRLGRRWQNTPDVVAAIERDRGRVVDGFGRR